jgi:outer membrane lipoprotein-sorting protein
MNPHRLVLLAALVPLAAAGCGSSDDTSSNTDKSAKAILADMRADLAGVHSYHVAGEQSGSDGDMQLTGDFAAPGSLRFKLTQSSGTVEMIATGRSATYIRADRAFWTHEGHVNAGIARRLAGRWVNLGGDAGRSLQSSLVQFSPENLGRCLSTQTGTVSKQGTSRVDGKATVVLVDKGDRPGTSPGRLFVAATGRTLPLRLVQTGRERPGGKHDPRCGSSDNSTSHSEIRLSRFDAPVKITPPSDALDLGQLASGGSGSAA